MYLQILLFDLPLEWIKFWGTLACETHVITGVQISVQFCIPWTLPTDRMTRENDATDPIFRVTNNSR